MGCRDVADPRAPPPSERTLKRREESAWGGPIERTSGREVRRAACLRGSEALKETPREDLSFYRPSVPDVILVAIVLLLSTGSIVWVARANSRQPARPMIAVVHRGNGVVERLDLNVDRVLDLPDDGVRIEVREGRVRILESDCPQQICVTTRWIRHPRQVIACVPNQILITIESAEEPFLDAIVG